MTHKLWLSVQRKFVSWIIIHRQQVEIIRFGSLWLQLRSSQEDYFITDLKGDMGLFRSFGDVAEFFIALTIEIYFEHWKCGFWVLLQTFIAQVDYEPYQTYHRRPRRTLPNHNSAGDYCLKIQNFGKIDILKIIF